MKITPRVSVILTHGNRVLLQNIRTPGDPEYVFLGGHLDAGETAFECAARELREELGVAIRPIRLCYLVENFWLHKGHLVHEHTFFVLARFDDEAEAVSGAWSVETGIWPVFVPVPEIPQVRLHPTAIHARFMEDMERGFPLVHLVVGSDDRDAASRRQHDEDRIR